jgi:hypothetical protein
MVPVAENKAVGCHTGPRGAFASISYCQYARTFGLTHYGRPYIVRSKVGVCRGGDRSGSPVGGKQMTVDRLPHAPKGGRTSLHDENAGRRYQVLREKFIA